jgi:hypothetical protein
MVGLSACIGVMVGVMIGVSGVLVEAGVGSTVGSQALARTIKVISTMIFAKGLNMGSLL